MSYEDLFLSELGKIAVEGVSPGVGYIFFADKARSVLRAYGAQHTHVQNAEISRLKKELRDKQLTDHRECKYRYCGFHVRLEDCKSAECIRIREMTEEK